MKIFVVIIAMLLTPGFAFAQDHTPSPYAEEQTREIITLSAEDLAELRRGGGWGLARAAELNGAPGPTHLLDLADSLNLDAGQITAISRLRDKMQADAIAAGERLIDAERALDEAFRNKVPEATTLATLVAEAGEARAALRLVHLKAHLDTLPLLSEVQIARYSMLRGYEDDPCATVPEGHDAALWRQHNDCS